MNFRQPEKDRYQYYQHQEFFMEQDRLLTTADLTDLSDWRFSPLYTLEQAALLFGNQSKSNPNYSRSKTS